MVIISGKHGDFVGKQETVFKASDKVKSVVKMYEDKDKTDDFNNLLKKLANNYEEQEEYLSAFSLIYMLQGLEPIQTECYNILKKI